MQRSVRMRTPAHPWLLRRPRQCGLATTGTSRASIAASTTLARSHACAEPVAPRPASMDPPPLARRAGAAAAGAGDRRADRTVHGGQRQPAAPAAGNRRAGGTGRDRTPRRRLRLLVVSGLPRHRGAIADAGAGLRLEHGAAVGAPGWRGECRQQLCLPGQRQLLQRARRARRGRPAAAARGHDPVRRHPGGGDLARRLAAAVWRRPQHRRPHAVDQRQRLRHRRYRRARVRQPHRRHRAGVLPAADPPRADPPDQREPGRQPPGAVADDRRAAGRRTQPQRSAGGTRHHWRAPDPGASRTGRGRAFPAAPDRLAAAPAAGRGDARSADLCRRARGAGRHPAAGRLHQCRRAQPGARRGTPRRAGGAPVAGRLALAVVGNDAVRSAAAGPGSHRAWRGACLGRPEAAARGTAADSAAAALRHHSGCAGARIRAAAEPADGLRLRPAAGLARGAQPARRRDAALPRPARARNCCRCCR